MKLLSTTSSRSHHSFFVTIVLCGTLFLSACNKNPLDSTDSHRVGIDNPKSCTITTDSLELQCVEGLESDESIRRTFRLDLSLSPKDSLKKFICTLDTSKAVPRLTLRASFVPTGQFFDAQSYALQRLNIRLDSVPIDGETSLRLTHGELEAVVLAYKKVKDVVYPVLDTIPLRYIDQYNFAVLEQNLISGRKAIRLALNMQVLSLTQLEGKRRIARMQAVMKLRY